MNQLESQVNALQEEVASLKAALAVQTSAQVATTEPTGTSIEAATSDSATGSVAFAVSDPTATARLMNPAIGVIGNFLGAAGRNSIDGRPSFEMAESELGFSAAVDPYARADFFLSFGEQGVDLEEGYITFPVVPGGFLVEAGKRRAQFGKVNTLHRHALSWVDRPLVTTNLLGGEEGLTDAGVSVSRLLPAPGGLFLEATGQVFRGDSEGIFHQTKRGEVATVAHLRGYRDLSEAANVDLGLSYAHGYNGTGESLATNLYGMDATFRWKPLQRSIYHSFIGRSELIWSQRREPVAFAKSFGYFASGEYQLSRRWFVGVRLDQSDRIAGNLTDSGVSAILTFWPSEFSQLRAQYRFTDYAEGVQANELLFQLQFSLGAHGAHPF